MHWNTMCFVWLCFARWGIETRLNLIWLESVQSKIKAANNVDSMTRRKIEISSSTFKDNTSLRTKARSVELQCSEMPTMEYLINLHAHLLSTRKYPLRGYILGVLTHTTALDRLWGGDGTLTIWF